MKLIVGANSIKIDEKDKLNAGEYNIHEVEFEFDEVYNDLIKKAVFSGNGHCYLVELQNDSCIIPYEVLSETGDVEIGAYGYAVNGDKLLLRYSPSPVYVYINLGSYKDSYDNYHQPTADVVEQLTKEIEDAIAEVEQYDDRITATETKLEGIENGAEVNVIEDIKVNGVSQTVTDKSVDITLPDTSQFITKDVNNLTYYELKTATGNNIVMSIDSSTYILTISLRNSANQVLNTQTVDLPLETMVVGGSYDETNKKIVLTLKNGTTIDIPVGDLVSGLQTEITPSNKLSADLVNDSLSTNKFVTGSDKTNWNNKYTKPSGGIPKTDLASDVQTSLGKADTALQSHQDISGKEDKTNKVTSLSSESTDTQYPSAKCVYDALSNLPSDTNEKTTSEGTAVLLNNTIEAKMDIELKPTQITYEGTPSPTSPVLIKTVRTANTMNVYGKNLFDINTVAVNYRVDSSGNPYSDNGYILSDFIRVEPNTQYTYSRSNPNTSGGSSAIAYYDSLGNFISRTLPIIYNSDTTGTMTTPSNSYYARITDFATQENIQFERNTQKTDYKEFTSDTYSIQLGDVEYCKMGDYSDRIFKTSGKNLFDKANNITQNTGLTSEGTTFSSNDYCIKDYLEIESSKIYVLSDNDNTKTKRICFYSSESENSFISVIEKVDKTVTFVTPSTAKYIRIQIKQIELDNEMLNEGSAVIEYEPYGTGEWYIKQEINKIILDGTTKPFYGDGGSNENYWEYSRTGMTGGIGTSASVKTDYFPQTEYSRIVILSNGGIYLRFPKNIGVDISTNTLLNTWLSNNNVSVYYVLDEPIYTKLNDSLAEQLEAFNNATSKDGQTHIYQDNNGLPFTIKASAFIATAKGVYGGLKEELNEKANKDYVNTQINNAIGNINTILATLTTPGNE